MTSDMIHVQEPLTIKMSKSGSENYLI